MPIYSDDPEEEYRIEQIIDDQMTKTIKEDEKYIGCLPPILSLDEVRILIPHTVGKYSPNVKGKLLCNGHCDWNYCNMGNWECEECGYIECAGCIEEFQTLLEEKIYGGLITGEHEYCRNCGRIDTIVEYYEKEEN